MNNNNAPFYVGQRVVFIDDSIPRNPHFIGPMLKKDDIYTVYGLTFSTGHDLEIWYIRVSEVSIWYACSRFAPIDERTISIPESLKEQAEEMIQVKETIQQPETQPA